MVVVTHYNVNDDKVKEGNYFKYEKRDKSNSPVAKL